MDFVIYLPLRAVVRIQWEIVGDTTGLQLMAAVVNNIIKQGSAAHVGGSGGKEFGKVAAPN